MKCANCDKDAFYIYSITLTRQVYYCHNHLPSFLVKAQKAGLLQTTDEYKSVIEEGLKNIATSVVTSPVVEEPEVEEVVVSKPKKKATKKKAE